MWWNKKDSYLKKDVSWSDIPPLKEIIKGLAAPKSSGEYKRARLAIERLQAPFLAVAIPVVSVLILLVVTATVQTSRRAIQVEIATEVEPAETLEEEEPPEDAPELLAVDPDAPIVDVSVDVNIPSMSSMTPAPQGATVSATPTVAKISSPVHMITGAKTRSLGEGSSFGTVIGGGSGGGGGGGIPVGYLIGEMFDFKRDASGSDIPGWNPNMYWEQARKLVNNGKFGSKGEGHVYKIPAKVALNKIFIEEQKAENGPKAFGVGDKMKPRGWLAHYSATLTSKVDGRFRFIGYFDDVMICYIDGKLVLEVDWDMFGDRPMSVTGWKSPVGKSPYGRDVVGDWFALKKGQSFRVDICVGERPGGLVSGRLMLDREGAEYQKDGNRPIWPLFTSRRLSTRELEKIRKDNGTPGKFKLAEEFTTPFRMEDPLDGEKGKHAPEEEVSVEVDI